MSPKIIFFIAAIVASTSSSAKDGVTTPIATRLSVDMGQDCSIRVADPFKGHLASGMPLNASYWTDAPPIKTQMDRFSVDLVCSVGVTATAREKVAEQHGATYDARKKKWASYFTDRDRKILGPVTKLYPLHAVNSEGFAVTTDSVTGDMNQRVRFISYCLFHDSKALCGNGQVMKLSDPQGNLLPYALTILRSIQFIDVPASASSSAKP